ncbi:MAG: undecaprenyl-phosphate galactose phosphotransferase WbaP [Elusimicrobiota bacterium]
MILQSHLTPSKLKNRLGILLLFVLDLAVLLAIFHVAVFLRLFVLPLMFSDLPEYHYNLLYYWWIFAVWQFIMLYEEGYSRRFAVWDEVKFVWKSAFFSSAAILTMFFLMKRGKDYSRVLIVGMFTLSVMLFPLIRLQAKKLLYKAGLMRRKVLIVGSGKAALSAYNAIIGEPNLGYEVVGFVDDAPGAAVPCGRRIHTGLEKIGRYIKSAGIHDVIVAKPEMNKDALIALINQVQMIAENTLFIPDITGIAVAGTELRQFFTEQTMVLEIKNNLANPLIYLTKRAIDYAAAALISVLLALPMLLIALRVKLSSAGPATYRQQRVGKNGKLFWCYKFRTMHPDADARLKELLARDPGLKAEWEKNFKLTNDPRVTGIGDFLRRTSLDELPQLLNILKGEMSLVGPRPVVTKEITEYYKEDAVYYFRVPPGLTGLWQVSGRSDITYDSRIALDSWYVKNWNIWLDIIILFKTVNVVLNREGAR